MKNTVKTFLLLAALSALLLVVGAAIGGRGGMMIALGMALVMNFGSYWFSDKIVLSMTRARPLGRGEAPQLEAMVQRLAHRAGIPMPRLYVVDDPTPNAFATGRNPEHGVVAVHTGLLRILDQAEVEGVIAHEIGHILNRDTLISAIAATFAGAIGSLANLFLWFGAFGGLGGSEDEDGPGLLGGLAMMILAPIMATLIQLAVSRSREYQADATAARLTGRPLDLADALAKLERGNGPIHGRHTHAAGTEPAMAHLMIVNPLRGSDLAQLFSTHPPIPERISRLEQMARTRSTVAA
jgi:heat shock protein HtpX